MKLSAGVDEGETGSPLISQHQMGGAQFTAAVIIWLIGKGNSKRIAGRKIMDFKTLKEIFSTALLRSSGTGGDGKRVDSGGSGCPHGS